MLEFTDETLPNGLRLILCPDKVCPSVTVVTTVNVGARHEGPGERELAHLFEHLMFEGSASLGRGDHMRQVAEAGGTCNAMTSMDYTVYFETMPRERLELALWLEAERFSSLRITQEGLDNQREVVWNEHRQRRENVPYGSARENLSERLFPIGHHYHSSMAAHADLANATLAGVNAFFATHYLPNNAVMAVVGDFQPEQVRELVAAYQGRLPKGSQPAPPADPPAPALIGEVRDTFTEAVPQARLYRGWHAPVGGSADAEVLDVLTAVLADGVASRLHRTLVIDLELATDVTFGHSGLVGGTSMAMASATVAPGVPVEKLETALDQLLADAATEHVTDSERERALALLERSTLAADARAVLRGLNLTTDAVRHDDPGRANTRLDAYRAVTAEDLSRVAGEVLTEHRVALTYLPRSA